MNELLAWVLCLSLLGVFVGGCVGLSCLFLKSCPACRMRIARTATKCPWCHEVFVGRKHAA